MSQALPDSGEPSFLEGEDVLRELRLQLEAVKARMEAHRETMEAAGLTPARPRDDDPQEHHA